MENRVLVEEAKIAMGNEGEGGVLLVAEATGGGEGIRDEAEMVEKNKGGAVGGMAKIIVNDGDEVGRRKGKSMSKLGVNVGGGFGEKDVAEDGGIDGGAGELRQGAEGTVRLVATTPKVDRRGVAVVADGEVEAEVDGREEVVVGGGDDELRAGGEEGEVEAEEVLKRGSDVEGEVGADEGGVGKGATVEGGDRQTDRFLQGGVEVGGKNEEEHVIGEEGNDEGVDEKDLFVKGEAGEDGAVEGEAREGLGDRGGEHPFKGNLSANRDTKMGALAGERQVGPRAGRDEIANPMVARGGGSGENQALGLVNTKAGNDREAVDKGEGRGDGRKVGGGDSEVISKGVEGKIGEEGEGGQQRVVGYDEEEGGEGATLLNPASDGNPNVRGGAEEGGNGDIVEGAGDEV